MYGWAASWVDMPANLVQGIGSAVISIPVLYALRKIPAIFGSWEKKI